MQDQPTLFDESTWAELPTFFERIPRPVRIVCWGDPEATAAEREALTLGALLGERFTQLQFAQRPRRINYSFYPVFGFMGIDEESGEELDFGVRIIGLPTGYQITSLIAAIQAVSFRGQHLDVKTRIQLKRLTKAVSLEIITDSHDEHGPMMSTMAFNLAVFSDAIKAYMIMGDYFPEIVLRYSVKTVPHLVINDRIHLTGVIEEETVLKHIAKAV